MALLRTGARRLAALGVVAVIAAACSGGGSKAATTAARNAPRAELTAARACRMWTEVLAKAQAQAKAPDFAGLSALAAAITPLTNAASSDDPKWNALALDLAAGVDFHSAALSDIIQRIDADCKAVPAAAAKTVAGEADPYSTTTTTQAATPSTTG